MLAQPATLGVLIDDPKGFPAFAGPEYDFVRDNAGSICRQSGLQDSRYLWTPASAFLSKTELSLLALGPNRFPRETHRAGILYLGQGWPHGRDPEARMSAMVANAWRNRVPYSLVWRDEVTASLVRSPDDASGWRDGLFIHIPDFAASDPKLSVRERMLWLDWLTLRFDNGRGTVLSAPTYDAIRAYYGGAAAAKCKSNLLEIGSSIQ